MSGRPSWKSAEIALFRPFSAFFALFRRVRRAPGKSRKRRKKPFFLGYPRICLNPPLLNPHVQAPNEIRHEKCPETFPNVFEPCSAAQFLGIGLFYLRLGLLYLRLVFFAYSGKPVWSFCLRWKIGLVFLLTAENWFGLFCLQFPAVRNSDLAFLSASLPPQVKKTNRK